MAVQAGKKAGPVIAGKTNKTPPPTLEVNAQSRGVQSPGQNGTNNPVALPPGAIQRNALAQNMFESVDDDVIGTVISKGLARDQSVGDASGRPALPEVPSSAGGFDGGAALDPELRKVAAGNVPTHPGTKGASAGPKVPSSLAINEGQPVRKPS